MPSVGPVHTPSAADAEYPLFTGDVVADSVVATDYVEQICDAAHVPYKVQNELLKHQAILVQVQQFMSVTNNQNLAVSYALGSSLYNWQSFH